MEIKYTNFEVDKNIFTKGQICGLLDLTGNYLYENIYDLQKVIVKSILPIGMYLHLKTKDKKMLEDLISELELDRTILKKNAKNLSTNEFLKVNLIEAILNGYKTVVLSHIDICVCYKDLTNILKTVRKHIKSSDIIVIYETTKPDNLLEQVDSFLVTEKGKIIYKGTNVLELPVETEIKKIVELARKKGVKLDNYRDVNDLLKAIYRSVK